MSRKLSLFGCVLSLSFLACDPAGESLPAETIEGSSQSLIVTRPTGRLAFRGLATGPTTAELSDVTVTGPLSVILRVERASEALPLNLYDGWFQTNAWGGWLRLSPSAWDAFMAKVNAAGGVVTYSLSYDAARVGEPKALSQFCYEGICLAPGSYPKSRTTDMRVLGTSCLGSAKASVGRMSDAADDGYAICMAPWR